MSGSGGRKNWCRRVRTQLQLSKQGHRQSLQSDSSEKFARAGPNDLHAETKQDKGREVDAATGIPLGGLIKALVPFATTAHLENVHPLQGGLFRLKRRSERRPGLPRENIAIFWLRFAWETLAKHVILARTIGRPSC